MKSKIICIVIILFFLITLIIIYPYIFNFNLNLNKYIKKAHSLVEKGEEVEVYIYDIQSDKKIAITNKQDINNLIEILYDSKVKKDTVRYIGKGISLILKYRNDELMITIMPTQIKVNHKPYKIKNNRGVFEKINIITEKYIIKE